MKRVTLLFDSTHKLLAEFTTENGSFGSCTVTRRGHAVLDRRIAAWQVRGLSALKEVGSADQRIGIRQLNIPLRDPQFLETFRFWALQEGLMCITCQPEDVTVWEQILTLPFSDQERYKMLFAYIHAPRAEISGWKTAIASAVGVS